MPKKITKEATAKGTNMLFAGMTPKAEQPADEEKNLKKKTTTTKKSDPESEKKKKAFTIWMDEEEIDKLQAYAKATGQKKGEIISAALSDHMKKHPATAEQKKAYQEKLKKQMFNV